jgi:hypothetical protein
MRKHLCLCLSLAALGITACHDSGGDDNGPATPSGESLVNSLILDNTTDSAEPVEINDLDLQFSESEDAFSSFFP